MLLLSPVYVYMCVCVVYMFPGTNAKKKAWIRKKSLNGSFLKKTFVETITENPKLEYCQGKMNILHSKRENCKKKKKQFSPVFYFSIL